MNVPKTYSLTDIELEDLTAICYREQGRSEAGIKACASQMCNYHDAFWPEKCKTPYQTVIHSGWYGSAQNVVDGMLTYRNLVTDAMIDWVRDVVCRGNRTLPEYVVEYDVLTDIRKATNNGVPIDRLDRSAYVKDVTKIQNIYGSEADSYTFYCFPDGVEGNCDAFGYFRKGDDEVTTAEKAIRWMEALASDNSHGYDQIFRWGEKGDYDCSSAVIKAWEQAGVPVKSKGGATYTGNMYAVFTKYGFKDVTSKVNLATGAGLKRSDVLLNHVHHVAMYCGDGMEVEASINEKGGAKYGIPGDQTGREILIREYRRNYPWDCVLRYESTDEELVDEITIEEPDIITPSPEPTTGGDKYMFTTETVKNGSSGASAKLLQKLLRGEGYYGANGKALTIDGQAGTNTIHALQSYQRSNGLVADGICGPKTWEKILGV